MKFDSGDVQADEIDFVDLIKFIWRSRRVVFGFIFLGFCLVSGLLIVKDAQYESRLTIDVGELPPYANKTAAVAAYKQAFTDEVVFSKWLKENDKTDITFDSFRNTKTINGLLVQRDDNAKMVVFGPGKVDQIVIKSRHPNTIIGVKSYSDFVNQFITGVYENRVVVDLEFIRENFQLSDAVVQEILSLEKVPCKA